MGVGGGDQAGDLALVLVVLAADPRTDVRLHPEALGDFRHHAEALVDRIGADAVGERGERLQVMGDLFARDHQGLVEGRLAARERRVGDAGDLVGHAVGQRRRAPLVVKKQRRGGGAQGGDEEGGETAHGRGSPEV